MLEAGGFSSWHARKALANGLVGEPIRAGGVHLYEQERVHELAQRPVVTWRRVFEICSEGVFVARRDLDATRPVTELLGEVSLGWDGVNPWEWLALRDQVRQRGSLPFLATSGGVVILGADIVGTRPGAGFLLAEPGGWFEPLEGCRFPSGPGRSWKMHLL